MSENGPGTPFRHSGERPKSRPHADRRIPAFAGMTPRGYYRKGSWAASSCASGLQATTEGEYRPCTRKSNAVGREIASRIRQKAFAAAKTAGRDVRILFGQGCHPEIDSLARKCGGGPSPVKNCIGAFLGEKARKLEENRTMITTPAWIRTWPHSVRTFLGWNEVDVRINPGRYDRILVIDPGLNSPTDEEILDFFDLAQVPVEVVPLDLGFFRETVARLLA